jgi:excisionase family DNA binding protein
MTVEETAKLLGIGRTTAYEAIERGEIPAIKIGSRRLVITAAVERMLAGEAKVPEATE